MCAPTEYIVPVFSPAVNEKGRRICGGLKIRLLDDPHPDDVGQALDVLHDRLVDAGAQVHDGVGIVAQRAVAHVFHVHIVLGEQGGDLGQHSGYVPVQDTHPHDAAALQGGVGQIHGVADIAVFQIVP